MGRIALRGVGTAGARVRAAAIAAAVSAVVLLGGCGPPANIEPAVAERCIALGGAQQNVIVPIPARRAGLLQITMRERGIAAIARIESGAAIAPAAATPIDRFGTLTLARDVEYGENVPVQISSVDSRDIAADVCISARIIAPADGPLAGAVRNLATADEATARQDWQVAFDRYLDAARTFDQLGMSGEAAASRLAMAELEYGYLQRRRDSLALAAAIPYSVMPGNSAAAGVRLALMAKALMELPNERDLPTGTVLRLLRAAAAELRVSPGGLRELPRLTIYEGFVEYRSAHPDRSFRLFEEAAVGCQKFGDRECFAQARQNAAVIAEERQNYPAALSAYEDALGALDTSRMAMLAADISYNLARLEARVGLFGRSEQHQREAMRLYSRLGQCDRVRRSASSLGEMLVHVGSVSDAAEYLEEAATLDCARLTAMAQGSSVAADSVARENSVFQTEASRTDGVSSLIAACSHALSSGNTTLNSDFAVFQSLIALGDIAKADDRPDATRACLDAARRYSVDARSQVRLLNARGELQLQLREPKAAADIFRQAMQESKQAGLEDATEFRGAAELGLGETALALGRPADARRHGRTALQLARARADVPQIIASLRVVAAADAAMGHRSLAARTLRSAIALSEQVPTEELDPEQRATYLATQHDVFAELIDLLASDAGNGGDDSAWRAFSVAEQGHARSFRYAIELASREHLRKSPQSGSLGYRELLRQIADLAADGREDDPGAASAGSSESALPVSSSDSIIDRSSITDALTRMHSTLVEYAAGDDDMYAFVTDGAVIHVARLGSLAAITAAAARLDGLLRAPEPVPLEIRGAAEELARLVLWPIREFIGTNRIVIVPDGALHTVPFSVLPWTSKAANDLLVAHAELSTLPSALSLIRPVSDRPASSDRLRFVLLGDPVFRSNLWRRNCESGAATSAGRRMPSRAAFDWLRSLPSLPGSRTEVLSIGSIVRQWRRPATVETLLQCAATAGALRDRAPDAAVIHIATHGLVDARRPRLSALALTPDAEGAHEAAFRLLDILRLPLHARMVVLSACDTSQGKLLPGEGVLGLAQAFLQAGAKSVVASYWRVEDTATQQFMASFYRHLLLDGMPAAAALRRTQLEQAKEGDSYSWAAFGLYGRPDSRL